MRFGTDGVRGRVNTELTAAFALDLGRAAARVLGGSVAVVGGDSRRSTPMLESALVAGLTSEAIDVIRLGMAPTPAVAFEAARRGAIGAVVSASHNPYHDNGIKLFARGGTKLPDSIESQIEQALQSLPAPSKEPGSVDAAASLDAYVEHLCNVLDGRRLDGLRIVVDAANGAAADLVVPVFRGVGADVIAINATPDGRNINHLCGATDVAGLQAAVVAEGAHAGIALDGDGDRMIAVDERGGTLDGDHVIAICADDLRDRGLLRNDTVVVTVMTNLGFHLAMRERGIEVVETAVGDRYVLEVLTEQGHSLGGEQSGHVIFPDHATTGDGMLTALVLLDVLQRSGSALSQLSAHSMTSLPQVLLNVPVAAPLPGIADLMADRIEAAQRALGDSGRVLVRASGTEPLVRVMVEAPTHALARSTAEQLADAARSHLAAPTG
jgi:phosphoglucosamine mutase